ncbi:endoplasmic reticulum junction formation protein lunapark-B isoform X2 [Cephus cinctus]|uniref:Endoplasmic reticulum junction formation protein lunapark n=1 Tax=Cephus cinctus TaxID=211228 RepID=A0AAJ7FVG5_CEPCN|nr:endoplasmic reticulum junction formation protein lunapark-B isoform X2 [Cephus cinctus]
MGILLSRFRKTKTTIEVLEDLDAKIKDIEEYGQSTETRHKKIVGRLVIYSVALYIVVSLIFYFIFFPAALYDQIFYMTPLLLFPFLILFTKKLISWYYKRKISRNQEKLITMQSEKKKILDQVTETETFKKAKEILLKFAPDQLRMTPPMSKVVAPTETPRRPSTPQAIVPTLPGAGELRRRALTVSNLPQKNQIGNPANSGLAPVGVTSAQTPICSTPIQSATRFTNDPRTGPRAPLPRPILPQQRSYLDRLVEYLVGDGPSNRYALICRQCESHNGMALKEEFEYFGFRCCYCNFWNPARKQKPSAPKLDFDTSANVNTSLIIGNQSLGNVLGDTQQSAKPTPDDGTSTTSDTDSDIEVVEKPKEDETEENEKKDNEKNENEKDENEKEENAEKVEN